MKNLRAINSFKRVMSRIGMEVIDFFEEIDLYRKKRKGTIKVSSKVWERIPNVVKDNIKGFFRMYVFIKYKEHYKTVDVRSVSIASNDADGGVTLRIICDTGEGWFNNGVI